MPKAQRKRMQQSQRRNKDKKEERKNDEMNKNKRDGGSGVRIERAEWPKRRKVNIARDGIRRNYYCIKIYRILKVRLGKLTSSCTHTSFIGFPISYASQQNAEIPNELLVNAVLVNVC